MFNTQNKLLFNSCCEKVWKRVIWIERLEFCLNLQLSKKICLNLILGLLIWYEWLHSSSIALEVHISPLIPNSIAEFNG